MKRREMIIEFILLIIIINGNHLNHQSHIHLFQYHHVGLQVDGNTFEPLKNDNELYIVKRNWSLPQG